MIRTTIGIEGMMCPMCESHIVETIHKAIPSAKKIKADRKNKQATFLSEKAPQDAFLRETIDATGYRCTSVQSSPFVKKSLFGF